MQLLLPVMLLNCAYQKYLSRDKTLHLTYHKLVKTTIITLIQTTIPIYGTIANIGTNMAGIGVDAEEGQGTGSQNMEPGTLIPMFPSKFLFVMHTYAYGIVV